MEYSLSDLFKKLDLNIKAVLTGISTDSRRERHIIDTMRRDMSSLRLYISDFQAAETATDANQAAKASAKLLAELRQAVLSGSEYGLFGPVDVAHLTAQIEQLEDKFKI